jgi:MoaA/NifB/PqqE/SkfB family radical SAM enzyme
LTYSRVDLSKYCVMSIWFGCNSNCTICMLSAINDPLAPLSFQRFQEVIRGIAAEGTFKNLILSGGEVTTFDRLEEYVRFAASLGWFRTIQIQTNGRKLADRDYLGRLVDCGVNEFFVSIHGLEAVQDSVARAPGAFRETMKGLGNLADLDVNVISNTVLTRKNLHNVAPLFARLVDEGISELHLWNYFPMERRDTKDLVPSMRDFAGILPELLDVGKRSGKAMVFKSFPSCLSLGEPGFFDGFFPVTVLPDTFWKQFGECGFGPCFHRFNGACHVRDCWGLSSAYLAKYGDERQLLTPRQP